MSEEQARKLVEELTLDEKLSMMDGDTPFWRGMHAMLAKDLYHRKPWRGGVVRRLGIVQGSRLFIERELLALKHRRAGA